MKITIPKKFKLGPYEIKIEKDNGLAQNNNAVGITHLGNSKIRLQDSCEGYRLTDDQIAVTFVHELLHYVFFICKRDDLCNDEKLVDMMAEFIVQAIKTSKEKLFTLDL